MAPETWSRPDPAPDPLVVRDGMPVPKPRAVAAIGNFDGIHLGHRRLLRRALGEAARDGRPGAALTFEPHPREHFRPDATSFRLTPEPVKLKILAALGIDIVIVRRFDAALATTSAADFVAHILARELQLSEVVVGENFHFGRGREGNPDSLRRLADAAGMAAWIEPALLVDGVPVSSSRIRTHLEAGEVGAANRLLGYRWLVSGEVRHGDKRGRDLGFPTANLDLGPGCRLAHGIYGVRVAVAPGEILGGVASFGRRPTFDDGSPLLEVHLFDFKGDLYGRTIEVEFLDWIRAEERFDSVGSLIAQMERDSARAGRLVARNDALDTFLG